MNKEIILYIAVVIGIIGLIGLHDALLLGSEQQSTITINEKWTKQHGSSMKYLCSDTNGNVYSIDDCTWRLQWDTSIKEGETYEIITIGWRIPMVSWYQNIVKIEAIE